MNKLLCAILLFFVAACLPNGAAFAKKNQCPSDYSRIDQRCILASAAEGSLEFKGDAIPLVKGMENNIYAYKTPSGEAGKLRILSLNIGASECTVYFEEPVTYGSKVYVPNSSMHISVLNNAWQRDRIYLDYDGRSALELGRVREGRQAAPKADGAAGTPDNESGKRICALIPSEGTELALLKKAAPMQFFQEDNSLLLYTPLVLIFIAIFLIVRVIMEDQDKFKTQEALEEAENSSKNKNTNVFIKITRPFYKRYFLPLVQGSKSKQGLKAKYRQKLANAGLMKEMTPEEFMALKLFMIFGGPFAFLVVRWFMSADWPLSFTPGMALVGYFYPNIWLSGLIARRADEVLRAMPFIVDMLALSVEAGLDFMAAIQKVIEKAPNSPLVEEFETLIKETRIGSSRAEGLRQLGWRVNIIEINSFCATLIAADSVGASIGPILKQLSNELRIKRSSKAEQKGATAATKILIPMVFFILPAVLVAIFAPIVLKMFQGGGT
jgi:tight adherence protein C